MTTWIDTHAHLQDEAFATDYNAVIARAQTVGVTKMVLPACNETDLQRVLEICDEHAQTCYPAIGLHPGEITANYTKQLATIEEALQKNGAIAIGEIGLDAYHYADTLTQQQGVFQKQLEWAKYYNLPVLIHARRTIDLVLETLEMQKFRPIKAILHAFEGNKTQVSRALANDNLMLGIGGLATFKNGIKDDVLRALDLSRTVMETDAPYLAPTPHRGKRNEPAYLTITGTHLAQIRSIGVDVVAQYTTNAAIQMLGSTLA